MTKPTIAKTDAGANERMRRYVEIDRAGGAAGSHPAARAAHERPQTRTDAGRVREYVRIERGRTA